MYFIGEVSSLLTFKLVHYIGGTKITSRGREVVRDNGVSRIEFGKEYD